jgi:6-phosphogluconolactonase
MRAFTSTGAMRRAASPVSHQGDALRPKSPARQGAGTLHVHPNGRTVYLANRASATVEFEGKKVFGSGENSIAAFSKDQSTGEPTLTRNIDGCGVTLRTFGLDPTGRMLVAASQIPLPVRDGETVKMLCAAFSVYRIGADGRLDFVRKYDVYVGGKNQFWSGVVALA